jgi:hypothetical protein
VLHNHTIELGTQDNFLLCRIARKRVTLVGKISSLTTHFALGVPTLSRTFSGAVVWELQEHLIVVVAREAQGDSKNFYGAIINFITNFVQTPNLGEVALM